MIFVLYFLMRISQKWFYIVITWSRYLSGCQSVNVAKMARLVGSLVNQDSLDGTLYWSARWCEFRKDVGPFHCWREFRHSHYYYYYFHFCYYLFFVINIIICITNKHECTFGKRVAWQMMVFFQQSNRGMFIKSYLFIVLFLNNYRKKYIDGEKKLSINEYCTDTQQWCCQSYNVPIFETFSIISFSILQTYHPHQLFHNHSPVNFFL